MAQLKLPSWIIGLIVSVLGPLLGAVTPQLKGSIQDFIVNLYAKARETDSPIDDVFVRFLAALLSVDLPD